MRGQRLISLKVLILSGIVSLLSACGVDDNPGGGSFLSLFAADGAAGNPSSNLYILDTADGSVRLTIGPVGYAVTGLAFHPTTGTLYGATSAQDLNNPGFLITIDKTTGAGTLVGDQIPGTFRGAADITFTSDGTLYGWSQETKDLVTIDLGTGAATVVGDSMTNTSGSGLAASQLDQLFFTGMRVNGPLQTVDVATGLLTDVAVMDGICTLCPINALAFNGGQLYGSQKLTAHGYDLILIDTTTGVVTSLGESLESLDALAFGSVDTRN